MAGNRKGSYEADHIARFRMEAITFQRIPFNVPAGQLKTLDLHECALDSYDLTKFTGLEVLLMRKNGIRTGSDITGLVQLPTLRVLDLRDNCFDKLEEFVSIANCIPSLVSIGIGGNKCTSAKNYRAKFLAQLPQLHESRCSLSIIDNDPITIEEICSAWKAPSSTSSREKFFHVLLLRKIPDHVPFSEVRELDLSQCGLESMDLSNFTSLEKLSLRDNSFDASNLMSTSPSSPLSLCICCLPQLIKRFPSGSQVTKLQRLSGLDLSCNNVCDFNTWVTVARSLPKLEHFLCDGNPSFPSNEPLLRINLISKLPYMKQLGAPLKFLNGFEISVSERVGSLGNMICVSNTE